MFSRINIIFKSNIYTGEDGKELASFLTLPSKKKHPEYYTVIEKPMDFHMIEKNISLGKYTDLRDFDTDVNLLFKNAEVCTHNKY